MQGMVGEQVVEVEHDGAESVQLLQSQFFLSLFVIFADAVVDNFNHASYIECGHLNIVGQIEIPGCGVEGVIEMWGEPDEAAKLLGAGVEG